MVEDEIVIREMKEGDRREVAELICVSTNYWYKTHGMAKIFPDGPESADIFYQVYSALEGSAGIVADAGGRLAGSCFFHVRPTHVSLGIMNVHPNYFGRGVARRLLERIIAVADGEGKPLRLVSSALNLDSFSLYTRAGFVPRRAYQDIAIAVPEEGLGIEAELSGKVRPATLHDVERMAEVEMAVSGIRRESDYRHFIENPEGFWHVSVCEGEGGELEGFLASGPSMLGPGVARGEAGAAALVLAELERRRGRSTVFLVPVECGELVRQVYSWGGRNCELHFAQVRGAGAPFQGVSLPTFMPETG
ncbi:MAG: GNAT family N-acetyltransferase [Acidobacteriota bacterium]